MTSQELAKILASKEVKRKQLLRTISKIFEQDELDVLRQRRDAYMDLRQQSTNNDKVNAE